MFWGAIEFICYRHKIGHRVILPGKATYESILACILERIFLEKTSAYENYTNVKRQIGIKERQAVIYDWIKK